MIKILYKNFLVCECSMIDRASYTLQAMLCYICVISYCIANFFVTNLDAQSYPFHGSLLTLCTQWYYIICYMNSGS